MIEEKAYQPAAKFRDNHLASGKVYEIWRKLIHVNGYLIVSRFGLFGTSRKLGCAAEARRPTSVAHILQLWNWEPKDVKKDPKNV